MTFKWMIALFIAVIAIAHSTNILDIFDIAESKKLIEVPEYRSDTPNRNCMCKGPACVCCVDFNITIVDIGGPGCVHMKYLPLEDGFSVKVSYGKNLIHDSKLQGQNPPPICLEVFGSFAQVCAKFHDMAPTSNGIRGCLELHPKLIGVTQIEFPIGCFRSTNGDMEMEVPPAEEAEVESTTENEETTTTEDDKEIFDAEDFLLGVYRTAEQGVAFLSSLLDIPKNKTKITTTPSSETVQRRAKELKPIQIPRKENTEMRFKNLNHPNKL